MQIIVDTDVRVQMSDGAELATTVWRHAGEQPTPALIVRSSYGKDWLAVSGGTAPDLLKILDGGYAVVIQDVRGTFGSDGDFVPFITDPQDGADTARWVAEQPWCDGRIGTFGPSYLGFTQWSTAITGTPDVRAIAPTITSADPYFAPWYSRGGAMSLQGVLGWTARMAFVDARRAAATGADVAAELGALVGAMMDFDGFISATPVADHPEIMARMPWLAEYIAHPARDEFWTGLSRSDRFADVTTPALHIGGWYDIFTVETVHSFAGMRKNAATEDARNGQQLIMGPWSHTVQTGMYAERNFGLTANIDGLDLSSTYLKFFDRHVRGEAAAEQGPAAGAAPVRIFVMGLDQWRDEAGWPLPDTQYVAYFLGGSGAANTPAGAGTLSSVDAGADAQDTFRYDPRDPVPTTGGALLAPIGSGPADQRSLAARDDILCFTTEVLEQAVEVTGHVSCVLHVSSSAPDTDITAKLVDVYPDGRALHLCDGILRLRYRDSLARAELMEPGRIYEVTVDMSVTSNVFAAGHRIRLDISSSNFPRYDRNSNTGGVIAEESLEQMVPADNTIWRGPEHPSRLVLPIISREGD